MRRPIPLSSTGKLDKDSDLQYINSGKGDYPELVDMEFTKENVYAQTTAAGNKEIVDFGEVTAQNQKVRVYFKVTSSITLELYNTNDQLISSGTQTVISGDLQSFKNAVKNIVQNQFTVPSTFYANQTGSQPYIDFLLDTQNSDWKLVGVDYQIIQEAITTTGTGKYIPIGSYDFLNDCFYWLTTQRNFKQTLDKQITNVTSINGSARLTVPDHGLKDGETIAINGATGTNLQGVNGIWVINVVNSNQFDLILSKFSGTWTSGGTITNNLYGYGCIGVVILDNNTNLYTFIPLLRSKKLNFITKKEIYQPQVELNGTLISLYYTDDYNLPRVTYYRGPYATDGCIQALYPKTGQYQYASLDLEIANQLIYSGYKLTFDSQLQSGGNLKAGNKRYAIRFISESLAQTELSLITNPIPCFSQAYEGLTTTNFVWGNDATVFTSKRNVLRVTGITPGLFRYIELICFEYIGTNTSVLSVSAVVVRRESLTPTQTEITLEHNGNETSTVPFDASTASQVQPKIVTARDNVIIQNRLVYGNVKIATDEYDLTDFCKTLKYSLHKKSIPASSYLKTNGEFYDPTRTENSVGYQAWEWYRFYIVGEYLSGSLSSAFFAFDVRFVSKDDYLSPNADTNFISPIPPNNANWEFQNSNGTNRRNLANDTFDNYDLSDNQVGYGGNLYQLYLKLENLDWNYSINGVPLKDIFRSFKVYRAERKDEVLLSGVFNKSQEAYVRNLSAGANRVDCRDFYYSVRNKMTLSTQNITLKDKAVPYTFLGAVQQTAKYGSFYAPDFYYKNGNEITARNEDKLISFGQAYQSLKKVGGWTPNQYGVLYYFAFYNGMTNCNKSGVYKVDESFVVPSGGIASFKNNVNYYKTDDPISIGSGCGKEISSYVLSLNKNVVNDGSKNNSWDNNLVYDDYALYNAVYFRRIVDKYGSSINSNNDLTYTNSDIIYNTSTTNVLGGDVFTQLNYLKKYINYTGDQDWKKNGGAAGLEFVSQNKVNTNLRVYSTGKQVFPQAYGDNIPNWLNTVNFDYYEQNSGYQVTNRVQARAIFDNDLTKENENILPTRKYYSELKPNGSKVDFYRIFLPFNFADNPQIFGPISRVMNVNNELFTVQERGYTREYFNSRGELQSQDAGTVLIGDGSVLKRIGTNLTIFGTDHSGAVAKGKSQSGKDVIMFISPDFSQVLRFGDDGLVSVSLRESMRTFFNNNLRWAKQAFTPADGYGICGTWDNNNKQFIFTVKAWQKMQSWDPNFGYAEKETVFYGITAQGVPNIYVATKDIQPNTPPPTNNSDWSQISYTDSNYYNVYTFTWSEMKAGFAQFYSYLPNHYTQFQGGVITPYPDLTNDKRSKIYLHGVGNPAEYYGIEFSGGKISLICNFNRDGNKKFFALWLNASNKPERVDITSLFRDELNAEFIKKSYLLSTDFETREGYQISPVKLETDTNGSNDGDTGQMEGIWARFDITFPASKKTNLYELIVHIRDSFRTFTS